MFIKEAAVIIDDTVLSKLFKVDASEKQEVDFIIEYAKYCNRVMQTIPQILKKYISESNRSAGKLFLENVLNGDEYINFPEIEDWTEEECILTLANTTATYCEKVWIISDTDYSSILSKETQTPIVIHSRVQIWKIKEIINKIKADHRFMVYYEERKKEEE